MNIRVAFVAKCLGQLQSGHVRTTMRDPVPLHYDSESLSMVPYAWPLDPKTFERLTPCRFEEIRLTHEFRGPCCFCAILEDEQYTEARIGIAEDIALTDPGRDLSVLKGEYVATCAKQRCGYFLCLERFYPLRGLQLQRLRARSRPLAPREPASATHIDKGFRYGGGLPQVMSDVLIRGPRDALRTADPEPIQRKKEVIIHKLSSGMSEDEFWATFVQCLVCKDVMFRATMATGHHACNVTVNARRYTRRYNPYRRSNRASPTSSPASSTRSNSPQPEFSDSDSIAGSTDSDSTDFDDEESVAYYTAPSEIDNDDSNALGDGDFVGGQASDDLKDEWEPPSVASLLQDGDGSQPIEGQNTESQLIDDQNTEFQLSESQIIESQLDRDTSASDTGSDTSDSESTGLGHWNLELWQSVARHTVSNIRGR